MTREERIADPFESAGPTEAKWQVSTNGGVEPLWAHSGRELFYRNGNNQLVAAEILTQPAFSVGEQRALFSAALFRRNQEHRAYDVTADDQRFVMIRLRGGSAGDALVVVENFFEELKAKVGN